MSRPRAGPRAWIVLGLGFGDCGKGTTTDLLARSRGARLVVRYNGGAQAGHNVVTPEGRHHTFSQLGAGSFVPGVRTHLAGTVIVHPSALLVEARHLEKKGAEDPLARLTIASACRINTPFHQAAGRLREMARTEAPHGSCGVGVGETARDALEHPEDALVAADLLSPKPLLLPKLGRLRRRLLASLPEEAESWEDAADHPEAERERALLEDPEVSARWLKMIEPLVRRAPILSEEEALALALPDEEARERDLVLEGAQGILLDEHVGFHPHTTWSTCTSTWAERWLKERRGEHALPHSPLRLGVIRSYATRHGAGPFPSEAPELSPLLPEPHNPSAGWQGRFRVGWPDPLLARYAIAMNGGIDALAVTHLDRLGALAAGPGLRFVEAYPFEPRLDTPGDLEAQAALGRALAEAEPQLKGLPFRGEGAFVRWLEEALGVPARILSRGPTYREKEIFFE
jgi:adenylosuccinate synthase